MDFLIPHFLLFCALIFLASSYATAYLLVVWFDGATVFVEYASLIKLQKLWPHFNKFLVSKEKGSEISYLEFLQITNPNSFFSKLLTCEKCLAFWISWANIIFYLSITRLINWRSLLLSIFLAFGVSYSSYKKYKTIKNG